jgi:hypothetical protein
MIKTIVHDNLDKISNKLSQVSIKDLRQVFPNKYMPVRPYNKKNEEVKGNIESIENKKEENT